MKAVDTERLVDAVGAGRRRALGADADDAEHDDDEDEVVVPEGEDAALTADGKKKGGWLRNLFGFRTSGTAGSHDEEDEERAAPGRLLPGEHGEAGHVEDEEDDQRLSTPRSSDPSVGALVGVKDDPVDENYKAFMNRPGPVPEPPKMNLPESSEGARKSPPSPKKKKHSRSASKKPAAGGSPKSGPKS